MSRLIPIPLLIFVWLANSCASRSFNILGICPSSSYSHQKPFQALMKALAARGHRVTVISTIPLKKPVENYEDIDVSFTYRTEDCTKLRHLGAYTLARLKMMEANELCEEQLSSRAIQELVRRKNQTFDAVIIEHLWYQCYYALVKHYNFPVMIGFLSVGNLPHALDSLGNPDDAVLNPDMGYPFTDRMTIRERLLNVLYTSWTRLYHGYWHLPRAQQIADKWIPGTPVREIDRNFSLLILGNNHILGYPKPLLPNIVEVHSLQIGGDPGALPKEIKDFLDNAEKGAVYFSLGSNLQTHQLPEKSLTALCNAFAAVEQRILWKHDGGVPFRSANVKFVKWAPQQAILAHDKVIAYIMQGGLQSLQEAVHYRVPVIAMPFFGDQHFNARKILDAQIGLNLNVDTLTNDTIVQVLKEIVGNPMYSRNINRMSEMLRDEQVKPMERAIWHVEHTLKFPNAKHLKYHGRDISWIAYYMIDLYACALIFIWVLYVIFAKVINKINHWARQYHLLRKVVNACATIRAFVRVFVVNYIRSYSAPVHVENADMKPKND